MKQVCGTIIYNKTSGACITQHDGMSTHICTHSYMCFDIPISEPEIATPPLLGSILPGVTRKSLLELGKSWVSCLSSVSMDHAYGCLKMRLEFFLHPCVGYTQGGRKEHHHEGRNKSCKRQKGESRRCNVWGRGRGGVKDVRCAPQQTATHCLYAVCHMYPVPFAGCV